jgi:hypothetical protein
MFIFAIPDSPVKKSKINGFVWQGFNILVFNIHSYGPENEISSGDNIQQFLVGIEYRNAATATGGSPINGELQLWLWIW